MGSGACQAAQQERRVLQWAEIAGLIEISADGSWRPTAFGKAQLFKLERDQNIAAE
jgi:hypothetical protein